jgi:CHAT domain-containing protein
MRVSLRYRRPARQYALAVVTVLALFGAATLLLLRHKPPVKHKVDPRVFAAWLSYRVIEPRLSGDWSYKPLHRPSAVSPAISSAGATRGEKPDLTTTPASTDEGSAVTHLLVGATNQAVDELKAIAWSSHNAAALNDLAAALLVQSDETDDVASMADSLAAADAALTADPRYEPALFNRALTLGRLGLAFESRRAWNSYLAIDHASPWADEALQNINALGVSSQSEEWERQFAVARRLSQAAAAAAVGHLARDFPEQARLWGEGEGLHDWAVATLAGDRATAENDLEFVRQIATSLRKTSGESLLLDVVSTIDAAVSPGELEKLARGHKTYWDGRDAHRNGRPAEAEARFRDAERIFAACGTPMVYLARYYIGSALHAQLKLRESADILDALASERLDHLGYRAVDATLGWERGACLMERGSLSAAMEVFTRSRDSLRALGETHVPAVLDAFLASAFDYAGDEREAWKARRRAFQGMSRSGYHYRLLVAVEAAAAAALRSGQLNRAVALLGMTTAEAERQNEPLIAAEAFTFRARLNAERGDVAAARLDEGAAKRWAKKLPDVSGRVRFDANFAFVDGLLLGARDPRAAIARFSDALKFFEQADRRVEVPRIYFERATCLDRVGDSAGARRDLDAGITFIESERRQIHEPGQRATLLAASDQLFEKAIDLALRADEREVAFDLVEHQRARALTEMFELGSAASTAEVQPMPLTAIRHALAPDAAVVEYALVANKLVAFVIRRESFVVAVTPLDAERLGQIMKSVNEAVQGTSGDLLAALTAADGVLLQPVRYALAGARHIAISSDRHLSGLPFAALYDQATGRFLIEEASLTMAPSSTLTMAASIRTPRTIHPSVVSVSGDAFDAERYPKAARLAWAPAEANNVASVYDRARVFASHEATRASVVDALRSCDIAHFAAHGVVKRPVANSALLLSPAGDLGGELRVGEIASLDLHRTGLVVLAACRSAGAVERNDGPENLALAFVAAGVPTTIASLTDLDDEVSMPLMLALHRRLAAGVDPATAVRDVACHGIRDPAGNIRRPLLWSNITVIGGSRDLTTMRKGES